MRLAPIAASLILTATIHAQAFPPTFVTSGAGCPAGNAPTLAMSPAPALGTTPVLTVGNLPGDTTLAATLVGVAPASLPLGGGAPGCTALVAGVVTLGMTTSLPTASLPLAVPTNLSLLGSVLELQSVALSPSSNALGIALSERGTMTIGSTEIVAGPSVDPASGRIYLLLAAAPWANAQATAQRFGGNLVTIDDAAESAWVANFASGYAGQNQVWIGLYRTGSNPWQWVSGTPVSFVNWASGEPNNAVGSGLSATIYPLSNPFGSAGQWNDAPSSWKLNAVVEIEN